MKPNLGRMVKLEDVEMPASVTAGQPVPLRLVCKDFRVFLLKVPSEPLAVQVRNVGILISNLIHHPCSRCRQIFEALVAMAILLPRDQLPAFVSSSTDRSGVWASFLEEDFKQMEVQEMGGGNNNKIIK
jgi:hypothetical protein